MPRKRHTKHPPQLARSVALGLTCYYGDDVVQSDEGVVCDVGSLRTHASVMRVRHPDLSDPCRFVEVSQTHKSVVAFVSRGPFDRVCIDRFNVRQLETCMVRVYFTGASGSQDVHCIGDDPSFSACASRVTIGTIW
jgi:hypothetical protein